MNEQTTPIALKLPLSAVNLILTTLAKQPFDQVAGLIQDIRDQTIPQVPTPEVANEASTPAADA